MPILTTGAGAYAAAGGGGSALSLDGSAHATQGGATSAVSMNLTTSLSNDIIIVFTEQNGGSVSSVVSSPTLTWAHRATAGSGATTLEEWWAFAPSADTYAITVTITGNAFQSVAAFGVNGGKTSGNPFDTNGSLPSTASSDPVSVSTTSANTMIIGGFRLGDPSTPGTGYTSITTSDFLLTEYKIVSAAQTSLSVTAGSGAGGANGVIGDAIVQGP